MEEKVKTHLMQSNFSFLETRDFYEIMWQNMVIPDTARGGNIMRRRTDAINMSDKEGMSTDPYS